MPLFDLLSDYTFQNVVMGASLLGLISGPLGCFAVLRRQSLLGDAISHAALPGICLSFIITGSRDIGGIIVGSLATGSLAALTMLMLTRMSRLKTDAGLGICLSIFFAVGIVLLTYIQNTHNASQGGLEAFLFGQAAATLRSDLWVMGGITLITLLLLAVFWKQAKLVTFDAEYARTLGMPTTAIEATLTTMVALAVVVGLQMVGVILMAAMIVAPAAAARQWSRHLGGMLVIAAAIGIVSGVSGATVSTLSRGLATGPLIVLTATTIVLISLALAPGRGLLWGLAQHYQRKRALRRQQLLYAFYKHPSATPRYYNTLGVRLILYRLRRQGYLTQQSNHETGSQRITRWKLTARGYEEAKKVVATFEATPS
ncbi:metal ABC transporter permease [Halomonas sp. A40-4]|jgi:manganese/zinc/iron transport system permease protein|uniref:metal ABC transporter permease n=1 Tax=Halomonas sp. A40-4 TaxID=2785909 RepID=UPI0018EF5049|nr:metal ABC transporter permease [Halomonas sp. A40-4]QPL45952.1 metal ABC transporter permease [Halomonas sp. A40-4]